VTQRRLCSVLFCDLVGFTELAESRDPEAVRELQSRYFDTARTLIGRYGGIVEKFIGDAVMAVWGTPVASEGDAERAVRAAMDIVNAVSQLGSETGVPGLAARAGVVTGEVAVALGVTGEGMVSGDAVNTASRVQSAAPGGQAYVDAATRRLSLKAIGFEDAGEHPLKGKAAPERLWRAVRVLSSSAALQRIDGLEAPLTGRDAELRTVKELFHAAVERRIPRMVVISGPAGVGKSRLGWEFEKYADGLPDPIMWHRGRCLSYGDGVAFWALAEIVRQRFRIADEDSAEAAAGKLADALPSLLPDPAEQAYVGPRLGRLLGVRYPGDSGGVLSREELFAGWRLFFERLAGLDPLVLLIEDAHHADTGLLDFLDHLIDWARDLPVFTVVFARPELEQRGPGFGLGRNRTRLTLDPLDAISMDRLTDALVPGMPATARSAITGHAQGIPLFAVETIRSLIDRDVVVAMDGAYRLVADVGELAVPDSLHALLAARLDSLDPGIRELVSAAAVLGSTFPAEALVAVCGLEAGPVQAGLAELLRREVLEIRADPLSPQRGNYRFAQEMLRQVAYDTLSRRDRKSRHLQVAGHLRATFAGDGDEVMDVIAQHYLDALAAVPEDSDVPAIRNEAVGALVRAAERAERAGAAPRAVASYARAAELVQQGGRQPDADAGASQELAGAGLWERAARSAVLAAGWDTAVQAADKARALYLTVGQPRAAARAQSLAGLALGRAGRHTQARRQLTDALAVLQPEPDGDTVSTLRQLARLEVFSGSPTAARLSAEALILGQAIDVAPAELGELFIIRGLAHARANRRAEAVCYLEYAARLAERIGDTMLAARAHVNLSDSLAATDPAAAAEWARAAARNARRAGDRWWLSAALHNLVTTLTAAGEWDEAAAVLAEGTQRDGLTEDAVIACQAWFAALRGDLDAASAGLADLAMLRDSEDPQDQAMVAVAEAFMSDAGGRPADALRSARTVLEHSRALGVGAEHVRWLWPLAAQHAYLLGDSATTHELLAVLDTHPAGHLPPILLAERQLARARVASADGSQAATQGMLDAVAAVRRTASPYHLAHALLDLAAHLGRHGDPAQAGAAVDEARAIAERLGARPLQDRATRSEEALRVASA
jgi:class 3 adenylate cyclase/tetratricopeptide (TPR) repeat protein